MKLPWVSLNDYNHNIKAKFYFKQVIMLYECIFQKSLSNSYYYCHQKQSGNERNFYPNKCMIYDLPTAYTSLKLNISHLTLSIFPTYFNCISRSAAYTASSLWFFILCQRTFEIIYSNILSLVAIPAFFQPRTSMHASSVMVIYMCMLYKVQ